MSEVEGQIGLDEQFSDWRLQAAQAAISGETEDTVTRKKADDMDVTAEAREVFKDDMADIPVVIEAEERAIVVAAPQIMPQQHLMVGLGALAAMDEAEFNQKLDMLTRGQERLEAIVHRLLEKGVDYGNVPGIARPFLQLPGAEKLQNFYGYAIEQQAERVTGDGVTSAPLAYHVKSYVHLGDFTGPIVAMGYGEANSWEPKYRYVNRQPECPECGTRLVKRKSPPNLAGKWNCPTWNNMGGCNAVFEPGDTRIEQGKIENPDPYGLAETLIQIAAKRSFVAAIRRATGTSGYFTQDEDSPSVVAQSEGVPPPAEPDAPVRVEAVTGAATVERGGKPAAPTTEQLRHLSVLSKERDLGPQGIEAAIFKVFERDPKVPDGDRTAQSQALIAWINANLTADELGLVIQRIAAMPVPAKEATPGYPPQQSDEK